MNILITGANGQLGHCMQNVAKQQSDNKYIFTDVCEGYTHLDITNLEAVREMVAEQHINCIVNCAAWTNVDAAESAGEIVETLNAKAPENLAKAMKEVGGLLIHISSDYVFGGDPYNTPCREDQKGTPTGVYGLTKLHGEQNIQAVGGSYVILRTSWLYSEYGKNFVKTMLNLTATKPQLKVVFDQVGTPTYAGDLANAIESIIEDYVKGPSQPTLERGGVPTAEKQQETQQVASPSPLGEGRGEACYSKSGIYHFSNEGVCSWYDFTKAIALLAGNTACEILPCHSSEFPSPVTRPSYSVLDKTKIKETFNLSIPYWLDSLRKCEEHLLNEKKD
jgi:dTDP-4-dehydrorhamnose reductase